MSSLEYSTVLQSLNLPLRVLVDNEISRLTVWANPCNDPKRVQDHLTALDKTLTDVRAIHINTIDSSDDPYRTPGKVLSEKSGKSIPPLRFTWRSASMSQLFTLKSLNLSVQILGKLSLCRKLYVS